MTEENKDSVGDRLKAVEQAEAGRRADKTKPLPYVYKLTHKTTGEFYFGFRAANKVPAHLDLGVRYFTSGKRTRKTFSEFDSQIISTYETSVLAFWAEQQLIYENRNNLLLINKHYQNPNGGKVFINNKPHTPAARQNISKGCKLKSPEVVQKAKTASVVSQRKLSDELKQKYLGALKMGPLLKIEKMPRGGTVKRMCWSETARIVGVNERKLRQYVNGRFLSDLE